MEGEIGKSEEEKGGVKQNVFQTPVTTSKYFLILWVLHKKNQWVQQRVLTETVFENDLIMIENRKRLKIWIRNLSSKF